MRIDWKWLLFFLLLLDVPSSFASTLRVGVLSRYGLQRVQVTGTAAKLSVEDFAGKRSEFPLKDFSLEVLANGERVRLSSSQSAPRDLAVRRLRLDAEAARLRVTAPELPARFYSGALEIRSRRDRLEFQVQLDLEAYVASVLPGEMPSETGMEALKAMAVLIRTYAKQGRHVREGFDFCDLTHCQVFAGVGNGSLKYLQAARATRGLILSAAGKPIESLYHAHCGGHTSANQDVFGGAARAYLQGVDDPQCRDGNLWSFTLGAKPLAELFSSEGEPASTEDFRILRREPKGRVLEVAWRKGRGQRLTGQEFFSRLGRRYGWQLLKSLWFEVVLEGGQWKFSGRGLGHGVGLCQHGAGILAKEGKRFEEILRHYFPGTRLMR